MSEEKNDDATFRDPKLAINRVYTRKGDRGTTRLVGGQKIPKFSRRIETYGTVDELNSFVGAARQTIAERHTSDDSSREAFDELSQTLLRVQHELFNLGSVLATLPEDVGPKMPRVTERDIEALEASIDRYNEGLPPLRSFVLPGGTRLNVELHQCRTICRRAERAVVALAEDEPVGEHAVAYLNRLSDAFFVWSRFAATAGAADEGDGGAEVLWQPNLGASGRL